MNKKFVKENYEMFAKDMTDTDILKVIAFIMDSELDDMLKRCIIQQFLLNWITVGVVSEKHTISQHKGGF